MQLIHNIRNMWCFIHSYGKVIVFIYFFSRSNNILYLRRFPAYQLNLNNFGQIVDLQTIVRFLRHFHIVYRIMGEISRRGRMELFS